MSQKAIDSLDRALKQWQMRKPALFTNSKTAGHRAEIDKFVNTVTIALEILKAEQPPDSEFTKIQRKAAQLAADAYEEDQEWCPTKTSRLLEACKIIDQQSADLKKKDKLLFAYESVRAPKKPLASDFTKDLRDEVETLQLYAAADDTRGAFKFADIYKACDLLDASEAENRQLKGEEPIPFAWWKDCPKLAQKTMERMIERFNVLATSQEELLAALKKYGDHEAGCIKGDACTCGLKAAIKKAEK